MKYSVVFFVFMFCLNTHAQKESGQGTIPFDKFHFSFGLSYAPYFITYMDLTDQIWNGYSYEPVYKDYQLIKTTRFAGGAEIGLGIPFVVKDNWSTGIRTCFTAQTVISSSEGLIFENVFSPHATAYFSKGIRGAKTKLSFEAGARYQFGYLGSFFSPLAKLEIGFGPSLGAGIYSSIISHKAYAPLSNGDSILKRQTNTFGVVIIYRFIS